MKKGLLLIIVFAAAIALYFLFFYKSAKETEAVKKEKPAPLTISKNAVAFNSAFSVLLNHYYAVKDALVNWDSTKAGTDALAVVTAVNAIPYNSLKADSNIVLTAKNFSSVIAVEGDKLSKAKTIEEKRRSFSVMSDNLYSLINTVRYDKEIVYHDMCPMAFGDEEQAYWLSRDSAVINPYLGNNHPKYKTSMLNCGSVEDSVNFINK